MRSHKEISYRISATLICLPVCLVEHETSQPSDRMYALGATAKKFSGTCTLSVGKYSIIDSTPRISSHRALAEGTQGES